MSAQFRYGPAHYFLQPICHLYVTWASTINISPHLPDESSILISQLRDYEEHFLYWRRMGVSDFSYICPFWDLWTVNQPKKIIEALHPSTTLLLIAACCFCSFSLPAIFLSILSPVSFLYSMFSFLGTPSLFFQAYLCHSKFCSLLFANSISSPSVFTLISKLADWLIFACLPIVHRHLNNKGEKCQGLPKTK